MIEAIEVGQVDSISLAIAKENIALKDSSFEALMKQTESFNEQLVNCIQVSEKLNNDKAKLRKGVKIYRGISLGFILITSILLIK